VNELVTEADRAADYRSAFYSQYHRALNITPSPPSPAQIAQSTRQFGGRWDRWLPKEPATRCLDIGCGTGEFLYYLKSRGYHDIQGVDLSAEELEVARALGAEQVFQENALAFLARTPSESLGLVSAFNFFEHLNKAEILALLPEVRRVLKPGGLLFAVTPNGLSPFGGSTRYWDFSHETGFTPSSWRQLSRIANFGEVHFEDYGPLPHSLRGRVRAVIWQGIRLGIMAASYVEVGGPRDVSKVYTADMKIILRR
jgi:SAM-dependent methyltransferase